MSVTAPVPTFRREVAAPLCVDLDGTLIKTDLLFELFLLLVKRRPLDLFKVPGWLLKGRAYLKQRLAASVKLDVTCLPYREPLLSFLREQKAAGRKLTLATAADERVAGQIAEHLGVFGTVVASDGVTNLSDER